MRKGVPSTLSGTFSINIRVVKTSGEVFSCCHSFVENGMIRYLDDCTHSLVGQTVELPDID